MKLETLSQMFSCDFSKISKNTFFADHLWGTTSVKPFYFHVSTRFFPFVTLLAGLESLKVIVRSVTIHPACELFRETISFFSIAKVKHG